MIKYKEVTQPIQEIVSVKCDVCGKEYNKGQDDFEIEALHHIRFIGGYASVFGDGTQVECDICQHCLQKMIGDFCRYKETTT